MIILVCIRRLPHHIKKQFKHYVVITKATPFIFGLILSYSLAEHAVVSILINHLTQTWGQTIPKAAIIVNILEGSTALLLLLVAHLSDSYLGCFRAVLCFLVTYTIGLIVTRFFPNHPESRSIYELYLGLALLALGRAAEIPLLDLMDNQMRELENRTSQVTNDAIELQALDEDKSRHQDETASQEKRIQDRLVVWWYCPWLIGATIALYWDVDWNEYTLVSAIVMAVGLLWFWSGDIFHFYLHVPVSIPLTHVYYVIKAAILKRHYQYPTVADQFRNNEKCHLHLLPDCRFLRWLDKAAIIERDTTFSTNNVQQHEEETHQIDVAKVEEVKFFLVMVPMLSTLLIYGLIEAMGSTFFLEQASSINENFNVMVFIIIERVTRTVTPFLWPDRFCNSRRFAILLKIGMGMMCSVLCCLSAYTVQVRRLHNDISIFWLTPQFIFLGLMKGLAEDGIDDLLTDHISESMRIYGTVIIEFVKGVAKFLCVVLILCFRSWISNDLSQSQLHRYYGLLGICGAGNLLLYRHVMQTYVEVEQQPQAAPISIRSLRLQRNSSSVRQRPVKNSNAEESSGKHCITKSPTWQVRLEDISEGSSNASPVHVEEQSNDVAGETDANGHDQQQDIEGDYVTESPTSALLKPRSFSLTSSSKKNERDENKNRIIKRLFTA